MLLTLLNQFHVKFAKLSDIFSTLLSERQTQQDCKCRRLKMQHPKQSRALELCERAEGLLIIATERGYTTELQTLTHLCYFPMTPAFKYC